jgi:hypothetical protein
MGLIVKQPFAETCNRGAIAPQPCLRELGQEQRRGIVLAACVLASSMAYGGALVVAMTLQPGAMERAHES